jgi:hypothetical protein
VSSRRSVLVVLSVAALLGLLALLPVPPDVGACGPPPRAAAWNQPNAQAVDELVSQPVGHADPAAQIRGQIGVARCLAARLGRPAEPGRVGSPGVDTGFTRSPPLV